MKNNQVFILAGGSGTRLAPLSLTTPGKLPKQFLAITGQQTMLQEAVDRIPAGNNIVIVPEERYLDAVCAQVGAEINIVAEPFGCNTATAIALCIKDLPSDTVCFFTPADHKMDKTVFQKIFTTVTQTALREEKIITIGITPDRPETGYGYIKTAALNNNIYTVDSFVEKPNLETAKSYLSAGGYFWNAGMFCFRAGIMQKLLAKNTPEIWSAINNLDILSAYNSIKENKQNISIDYAVMEKEAENILLYPAPISLDWNDVGGWAALEKYQPKDSMGNLILNYLNLELRLNNCHNLLIVTTTNGILITTLQDSARAKDVIPGIEQGLNTELLYCTNVTITNTQNIYLGAIAVENLAISLDQNTLTINKL